jgi:23S rRNA pseudouridine1911/1915/1917 synthase
MELKAEPEDAGARLDAFLAAPLGSRAQAQRLIEAGAVRVDGAVVPKRHRVSAGETVTVDEPAAPAPAADVAPAEFAVPFQDEHLLIVDKPAGVVVHPARGHASGTLAQALAGVAAGGEEGRAGIVHRLDRDTSGLLVVARTAEAHRRLKAALQAREITREYLALVEGRPPARRGTIDAPIGRDRRVRTRMST